MNSEVVSGISYEPPVFVPLFEEQITSGTMELNGKNRRYITDFSTYLDLGPELTPLMEELGYESLTLDSIEPSERDNFDRMNYESRQHFINPNDVLVYKKDDIMIHIKKYPLSGDTTLQNSLPFNVCFKFDLKKIEDIDFKKVERLQPGNETIGGIGRGVLQKYGGSFRVHSSDLGNVHPQETIIFRKNILKEDNENGEKPNQFYFSRMMEVDRKPKKSPPLQSEEERKVIASDIAPKISESIRNIIFYTEYQIGLYKELQKRKKEFREMSGEFLVGL